MITILSIEPGLGHGAEAVLSELLRAWPTEAEDLTVVSPLESAVFDVAEGCGHRAIPLPSTGDKIWRNWLAAGAVAPEVRASRHVHAWAARGFEGARRLASRLGVSCSGTLHDHPHAGFHGRFRRRIMKRTAAGFDGLVCVSDAVRDACRDVGYGCPLTVIRNGLAEQETVRTPGATDAVRVGFLGMNAPLKGFPVIRAWIEALEEAPIEWRLYGTLHPQLAGLAAETEAQFGARVRLCGRRPVPEIFSEIDLLAHASSGFDSLPTVLIEAARAGIPSVASRNGGAGEIVIDGETGFLFSPDQPELGLKKLRELITDSTLREGQAVAARRQFQAAFNVERMVREYKSFWSEGRKEHHAAK